MATSSAQARQLVGGEEGEIGGGRGGREAQGLTGGEEGERGGAQSGREAPGFTGAEGAPGAQGLSEAEITPGAVAVCFVSDVFADVGSLGAAVAATHVRASPSGSLRFRVRVRFT